MSKVPASIRSNNPGAMWGGPSAKKFGAKKAEKLNDGLGQNNEIAYFPTKVHGGAALFDLLARVYAGKTIRDAITKWSGGNWVSSYLTVIEKDTGLEGSDVLSLAYLKSDKGILFAKAMARHEAGCVYPMTDEEWKEAQDMAFKIPAADVDIMALRPWIGTYLKWEADGVHEIPGAASHPEIDRMFELCGHPRGKYRDNTAHCAAAANASLAIHGVDIPPLSKNLMARSLFEFFPRIPISAVVAGSFRIEDRAGPSWAAHVDLVLSVDHKAGTCEVIGANVKNKKTGFDGMTRRTLPLKGAIGYVLPALPSAPAPKAVTAKDLAPVSQKVAVLRRVLQSVQAAFAVVASYFTLENLQTANGAVTDVNRLANDLALPSVFVLLGALGLLAAYLLRRTAADYNAGHYTPSGEREPLVAPSQPAQ